jgi:hypothetical protein
MLMSFAQDRRRFTFGPVFLGECNWDDPTVFPLGAPWKPAFWE